jgi:hypothetical protein
VPSDAQILPGLDEQSPLLVHWTHDDVLVLHSGVSPEQPALLVQPARQLKS